MKKKGFLLISMGFEAGILLTLFIYTGQKAEAYFDTGGWITACGVILALSIWFYRLIGLCKQLSGRPDKEKK